MRRAAVILIACLMAGLAPAAPTVAAPRYTFAISVGTPCLSGHGPANAPLHVTLRSSGGQALGARTVSADGSGHWSACFAGVLVEPAMRVTAAHAGLQRTLTVPTLTLHTDRPSDVMSGSAPVGTQLAMTLTRCVFSDPCLIKHYPVTPDSHGHYRADVSADSYPWDLEGGDRVVIGFHDTAGDSIEAVAVAAEMRVRAPNRVTLQIYPAATTVTVRLLTSGGAVRASRSVTAATAGSYTVRFSQAGQPLAFQPGNVIRSSVATDARIVWPDVQLTGHPATERVSGRCLKDAPLQVTVTNRGGASQDGVADSEGRFTLDFSTADGIQSGDALQLVCRADSGDRVEFAASVP